MLGGRGGEKAFQILPADYFGDKFTRAVEEREKTIPIDGEQERCIPVRESAAGGERIFAASEPRQIELSNGIGIGKLGDMDQFLPAGSFECIENIQLEQGFESALFRHPDRFGFKKALKRIAGRIVAEVLGDCADGGEENLVQFGAVVQSCLRGNVGPGAFYSEGQNLIIAGILFCRLPG